MANLHLRYGDLTFFVSRDQVLQDNFDFRYSVFHEKDMSSELNALCDTYGSDKGEIAPGGHPYPWPSHTYADFYEGFPTSRD